MLHACMSSLFVFLAAISLAMAASGCALGCCSTTTKTLRSWPRKRRLVAFTCNPVSVSTSKFEDYLLQFSIGSGVLPGQLWLLLRTRSLAAGTFQHSNVMFLQSHSLTGQGSACTVVLVLVKVLTAVPHVWNPAVHDVAATKPMNRRRRPSRR